MKTSPYGISPWEGTLADAHKSMASYRTEVRILVLTAEPPSDWIYPSSTEEEKKADPIHRHPNILWVEFIH